MNKDSTVSSNTDLVNLHVTVHYSLHGSSILIAKEYMDLERIFGLSFEQKYVNLKTMHRYTEQT